MNTELKNEIHSFNKSSLIKRIDFPYALRKWVYSMVELSSVDSPDMLATYICNSAGFYYDETPSGWVLRERYGVCAGCLQKTMQYVCSKRFKKPFCFRCWFDCDQTFI